jgi:predicted nucleic acid-binding protein
VTTVVWDTACLFYAAKAERLDVLGDCARRGGISPWRNVTTQAVVDELATHGLSIGGVPWLEIVHVDGLDELAALVAWMDRLGSGQHHRGEATVCAWADVHGAVALLDDRDAKRVATRHGLRTHGSLWLLAEAVRTGLTSMSGAANLVDVLLAEGARYPLEKGEFGSWCRRNGLAC